MINKSSNVCCEQPLWKVYKQSLFYSKQISQVELKVEQDLKLQMCIKVKIIGWNPVPGAVLLKVSQNIMIH